MDTAEALTAEVLETVDRIKPLLTGRPREIQGAILAELLSLWLAGHWQGGDELIERMLTFHVAMVRKLLPTNIRDLRDHYSGRAN